MQVVALSLAAVLLIGADGDGDGVFDHKDNCIEVANPAQIDADLDGYGNLCDADLNNDGAVGVDDLGINLKALGTHDAVVDLNNDGAVGADDMGMMLNALGAEPGPSGVPCAGSVPCIACSFGVDSGDRDGDGVPDDLDNCLDVPNGAAAGEQDQLDGSSPSDGFGNICDGDFNDDGLISSEDWIFLQDNQGAEYAADLVGEPVLLPDDTGRFLSAWPNSIAYNAQVMCEGVSGVQAVFPGPSGQVCESMTGGGSPLRPGFYFEDAVGPAGGTACGQSLPSERERFFPHDSEGAPFRGYLADEGFTYGAPLTYVVLSQPASGRITVEDQATGRFRFDPDPGWEGGAKDTFSWVVSDGHAISPVQEVTLRLQTLTPEEGTFAADDLASRALVVYNTNAVDALELAEYYAGEEHGRGIDAERLCPVEMPNGLYASKDQMLSMRKQILEGCICPLIPVADRPVPCEVGPNLEAIAQVSPISHLVLIKGLPARVYGTEWPPGLSAGGEDEPSLDFVVSHLLYRDEDLFCEGCEPVRATNFDRIYDTNATDLGGQTIGYYYWPPIDPGTHRLVAYGRVEAIDTPRTRALIDRTLAAEAEGLQGNVVGETSDIFAVGLNATGTTDADCLASAYTEFAEGEEPAPWDYDECRVGTTYTGGTGGKAGLLPGELSSTIPSPINVGLFLGGSAAATGQTGFANFDLMARWHKSEENEENCTELCSELPDEASRSACVDEGNPVRMDYFGELNPECVGVAPGFIGYQHISYPVGYYGFFPPGWQKYFATESTPPVVLEGGAHQDETFTDDRYLHLGVHDVDHPDLSTCVTTKEDGSSESCPEEIALVLLYIDDEDFEISENLDLLVRLRHRNRANPARPGKSAGQMRVETQVFFTDDEGSASSDAFIDLADATTGSEWEAEEAMITVEIPGSRTVDQIRMILTVSFSNNIKDFLDLDAVEIVDLGRNKALIPTEVGSFAQTAQDATHLGDWAANAIDRLGGIAFWGSSSHYLNGGRAFWKTNFLYRRLLSGRTLGESVLSSGKGASGIIYGDPLYRPVAAALYSTDEPADRYQAWTNDLTPLQHPGLEVTEVNVDRARTLVMSAMHGTESLDSVQWQLATCSQLDLQACDANGLWVEQETGVGSAKGRSFDWTSFIDPTVNQPVVVRLKVENPSYPERALYDYAFFNYQVNTP